MWRAPGALKTENTVSENPPSRTRRYEKPAYFTLENQLFILTLLPQKPTPKEKEDLRMVKRLPGGRSHLLYRRQYWRGGGKGGRGEEEEGEGEDEEEEQEERKDNE